jgi:hyperosmotically inducible periplasmic protein
MKTRLLIGAFAIVSLVAFAMPSFAQSSSSSASPGAQMEHGAETFYHGAGNEFSDAALTTKVKAALFANKATRDCAVHVHVYSSNGVVILTGIVPTVNAAHHVGVVAEGVSGVKLVRNDLTINPNS